jgi:phage baseplate assembly protein W
MAQKQPLFGNDFLLTPFYRATEWDSLDVCTDPALPVAGVRENIDIASTGGIQTLRQAIVLRLLTPLGCLADLGHAGYGSRLSELVGELNTEATRNRAKVYVLQALAGEKRIRKIINLSVEPPRITGRTDTLTIVVDILALDSNDPLRVGLEVAL